MFIMASIWKIILETDGWYCDSGSHIAPPEVIPLDVAPTIINPQKQKKYVSHLSPNQIW